MDLSRYADLFLSESREHLSEMNARLLELERAPADAAPVGAIFRAVHTLKGMSATMGYRAVTELAHEMETLLDRVRRSDLAVTPPIMDLFFRSADVLESAIERSVAGEADHVDVGALVARLKAFAAAPAAPATGAKAPRKGKRTSRRVSATVSPGRLVRVRLAPGTALRGARAFLIVKKAEALGRVVTVLPAVEALTAEEFDREFALRLDTLLPAPKIEEALRAVGDIESVEVDEEPTPFTTAEMAIPADAAAVGPTAEFRAPGREVRHVRIDLRRLDALMDLVGELVIARGRLAQVAGALADAALDEVVTQTSRLIGEMQDEIMRSRMVPVGQVFDRFPRLVRDSARALGKEIEFTVEGKDTELDRSMLDDIGEPIVHLLRNAIDHGIESPDARVAAGKAPMGRLALTVARERSMVMIRVADDGRGIDRARVLQKAKEQGLVPLTTTSLGDEELTRIIARPGFSTAERVTDLSGRGVGIDVVTARVRAMGGTVDIRSVSGAGTSVTLRMPVTLAIVRALLARVGDETYAVPMTHVSETVELQLPAMKRLRGKDVLVMRDEVLPVLRCRELVHLPPASPRLQQVIVLEHGERRAGLVVDELTGQQDIVVKPFDPVRDGPLMFSGATILADGAPALILDVGRLL